MLLSGAQLEWREDAATWRNAEASLGERRISTPVLGRELDYWAAIHEIGHFATGDLPTADEQGKILWDNEEAVWYWALDNGVVTPSGAARGLIYSSFSPMRTTRRRPSCAHAPARASAREATTRSSSSRRCLTGRRSHVRTLPGPNGRGPTSVSARSC
jgi:hypothetical protein